MPITGTNAQSAPRWTLRAPCRVTMQVTGYDRTLETSSGVQDEPMVTSEALATQRPTKRARSATETVESSRSLRYELENDDTAPSTPMDNRCGSPSVIVPSRWPITMRRRTSSRYTPEPSLNTSANSGSVRSTSSSAK